MKEKRRSIEMMLLGEQQMVRTHYEAARKRIDMIRTEYRAIPNHRQREDS